MTIKTTTKMSAITAVVLALGACASNDVPIASMSCTDLAREIGKVTQVRDDAAIDSIGGTIDMLAADTKEDEISGGVESLIGDISGAAAQNQVDTLNRAFVQKGCR